MTSPAARVAALVAALVVPLAACSDPGTPAAPSPGSPAAGAGGPAPSAAAPPSRARPANAPAVLKLPNGFAPEGMAVTADGQAYLGQRETGAIYKLDLATGRGAVLAPATGKPLQGIKERGGRLYVTGAEAGDARVLDATTGRQLASYQLVQHPTEDNNLVNDDVLTADAWWLTDSRNAVLYRIPLPADGSLPPGGGVKAVPLTGDLHYEDGINANGIAATDDGSALLVVQSNTGKLFRVDPASGRATAVGLGGETLDDGDGVLVDGRTVLVAQNESSRLAVLELDPSGTRGRVVRRITDPRFDQPTTIARWGDWLYLPNARFDVDPGPAVPYTVVAVPRPR
ncbi:MAG TPA: superoxide dismutase [Pseudonocardia sp.]|jgi:streptogramin lyase